MKKLALDNSDFEHLRNSDLLYVDKTPYIHHLLEEKGTYYFLSRPRRFGKSLFISTLENYFLGKKELFKDLYIYDKTDWEKHEYPVIRLNFSDIDSDKSKKEFEGAIIDYLDSRYAWRFNLKIETNTNLKNYLNRFILAIHHQTGKKVVMLIDEYDKPITDHIKDLQKIEDNQTVLRKLYDWLKNNPQHLRFVFLTGISKFAKMSVFSALSNVRDISEQEHFNGILGFTRSEIEVNFQEYLIAFAKKQATTVEEILKLLKFWYDGYSWNGEERVFNSYSILYVMHDKKFKNYWYGTGTPKLLIDFITRHSNYRATQKSAKTYENIRVEGEFFMSKELSELEIDHLLYNTGYLTINYKKKVGVLYEYYLNYPNYEVRWSFTSYLLNYFYKVPYNAIKLDANSLRLTLEQGDLEKSKQLIRRFFNNIPYELRKNTDEAYYHSLFQMLMMLIGVKAQSEESGSMGRADVILPFSSKVYIIEFKYAQSGTMKALLNKAIQQITDNQYAAAFEGDNRPILSLGIGFLEKKQKGKIAALEIDCLLKD
ncbi:MAG: AAA family ATPase [Bacteroidota bacterium]